MSNQLISNNWKTSWVFLLLLTSLSVVKPISGIMRNICVVKYFEDLVDESLPSNSILKLAKINIKLDPNNYRNYWLFGRISLLSGNSEVAWHALKFCRIQTN